MKIINDNIVFSTGKIKYANRGIIGIDCDGNITEGYDGNFLKIFEKESLTQYECIELANYMIQQWQNFREKHKFILNTLEG